MDKAKILRECTRIEEIVTDAYNQHRGLNYYDVKEVVEKAREIVAEVSAPPKTNADRIRQMTDEELAEFLLESRSRCKLCKKRDEICEGAYHECWNGIDDWLKQEVSEDVDKTD